MVLFFLHIHFFCIINIMQVVTVILIFNHWVICWSFFWDTEYHRVIYHFFYCTCQNNFLYIHATTLVIQIVPNIFTFFLPMIFYVCCNFTKLFFRIFYVCSMFFLNLYLFIVIKVTKKWSQQQHKLTAIPMLIRGLSKTIWWNPLIWYFLYSLFFAYQMIGLYYSIFFLCYIY